MNDPTWSPEYEYFFKMLRERKKNNLSNDIWINKNLKNINK